MSKHSLGPWMFVEEEDNLIMSADGFGLAEVFFPEDGPLIAAAPELLDSVEALVHFIALIGSEGDPMQAELITNAQAAIAKAKGEE